MHVHMARARWWCPISSPKADLILLSGVQYHTLRSLPRPNIHEEGHRTPDSAPPDGRTDGRRERKCKSRKRVGGGGGGTLAITDNTDPLGQADGQSSAAAAAAGAACAALPCCRRLTRADHVFAREGRREGGKKGEPPSISIISGLISALPTKLLRSTSDRLLC